VLPDVAVAGPDFVIVRSVVVTVVNVPLLSFSEFGSLGALTVAVLGKLVPLAVPGGM